MLKELVFELIRGKTCSGDFIVAEMLQQLDDEKVEGFLLTTKGFLGAVDWWLSHPELLNLLRFKYSTIEDHLKRTYEGIKGYLPEYQVMTSSRTSHDLIFR